MLHQMLHGVAEPFNNDFNKDSNVDFGIVIVNALFLQHELFSFKWNEL